MVTFRENPWGVINTLASDRKNCMRKSIPKICIFLFNTNLCLRILNNIKNKFDFLFYESQ